MTVQSQPLNGEQGDSASDFDPYCFDCACLMSNHNNDECGGFCGCGDCDGFAS